MIDSPTLRKLGTEQPLQPAEVLAEACLQAAESIEEICKQMDGVIRVAADALKRLKEREANDNKH
jgi:hypothetical protein